MSFAKETIWIFVKNIESTQLQTDKDSDSIQIEIKGEEAFNDLIAHYNRKNQIEPGEAGGKYKHSYHLKFLINKKIIIKIPALK